MGSLVRACSQCVVPGVVMFEQCRRFLAGALLCETLVNVGFRGCHARYCRPVWAGALLFESVVNIELLGAVMFGRVVTGPYCANLSPRFGFGGCHGRRCRPFLFG